jgi:hypothetical protein
VTIIADPNLVRPGDPVIDLERAAQWYKRFGVTVERGTPEGTLRTCATCKQPRQRDEFDRIPDKRGRQTRHRYTCRACYSAEQTFRQRYKKAAAERVANARCETCAGPVEDNRPAGRGGRIVRHCAPCIGTLTKPPYGYTTCPNCGESRHLAEFRNTPNGRPKPGNPYQACQACRGATRTP